MRIRIACFFLMLSVLFGSYAAAGPGRKSKLSFASATDCGKSIASRIPFAERCETRCLNDEFKAGLPVVLVEKGRITEATTGAACTDSGPLDELYKATQLREDKQSKDGEVRPPVLALVGVDRAAVRLVPEKKAQVPLPKDIEDQARHLLKPTVRDLCGRPASTTPPRAVADSPPRITRAGDVALLKFWTTNPELSQDQGPSVLLMNGQLFRLCGACWFNHLLFEVNNKLYLASWINYCCIWCGELIFVLYDLSGKEPKVVFEDGTFST